MERYSHAKSGKIFPNKGALRGDGLTRDHRQLDTVASQIGEKCSHNFKIKTGSQSPAAVRRLNSVVANTGWSRSPVPKPTRTSVPFGFQLSSAVPDPNTFEIRRET